LSQSVVKDFLNYGQKTKYNWWILPSI